ncbi:hypothetical protein HZS_981 [Henneguya salminicola]|nr:hypothetical protein HZS_981 [Henneguya salminicola]
MPKKDPNYLVKKSFSRNKKIHSLGKLKWYCQMCEKQCRDECGFRRHCTTESHRHQLALFAEDPDRFIDQFSEEFERDFINLLKRRYGNNPIEANVVYQEYINDRNHTHMNSTKWNTLLDFINYLSEKKICRIQDAEKGWEIEYTANDPSKIIKTHSKKLNEKSKKYDQTPQQTKAAPLEHGLLKETPIGCENNTELAHEFLEFKPTADSKISFKLKPSLQHSNLIVHKALEINENRTQISDKSLHRKTELENLINDEFTKIDKSNHGWILTDVEDKFVATVKIIDSGNIIKLDQVFLQTIIPAIGREIILLEGHYRGCKGKLIEIDEKNLCANVQLINKPFVGKILNNLSFDNISKMSV